MRMSCNGCRVLRKGCSEDCSIRPCLEWIKCPQSQANATLFLAKFYGRAGLINLINSGSENLRPGKFLQLVLLCFLPFIDYVPMIYVGTSNFFFYVPLICFGITVNLSEFQ